METLQPWAADWPSWKIPNGARELIWPTIVRRGLADCGEYRHAKPASPKPFKAALICSFARLSPRRPRARQSRQRALYNRGLSRHHRKKESRPLRRPQSSVSVTAPPAPVSVVAMVVARIVGVVAMVVAVVVPGCGGDHAADRDCADNA